MNQEKIGRFISECRKNKKMTQQELADKLSVSKNAVSKWERGLNLPDASLMPELCKILSISLNDLFSGEKIPDNKYKEIADNNLLSALENSTFTLKDKIDFFKKKWKKEHLSNIILSFITWTVLLIALKLQSVEIYLIGTIGGLLAMLFYIILYNKMMAYIEKNAYGKNSNISIDDFRKSIKSMKEFKKTMNKFDSKEEAINYLIKETGLSKQECTEAYNNIIKIDFNKIEQ